MLRRMSIQRGGSIDWSCAVLSRRGGRRSKVRAQETILTNDYEADAQISGALYAVPRSQDGMEWAGV